MADVDQTGKDVIHWENWKFVGLFYAVGVCSCIRGLSGTAVRFRRLPRGLQKSIDPLVCLTAAVCPTLARFTRPLLFWLHSRPLSPGLSVCFQTDSNSFFVVVVFFHSFLTSSRVRIAVSQKAETLATTSVTFSKNDAKYKSFGCFK